jgi:hypothetical protein
VEESDPGLVIAEIKNGVENVFWKTTVVNHAMAVEVSLPTTLRIYKPSSVYGDVAEDSRFAAAAQFASARNLFDDGGIFDENGEISLTVLLRALYQLEGSPKVSYKEVELPTLKADDGFAYYQVTGSGETTGTKVYNLKKGDPNNEILIWAFENNLLSYMLSKNYNDDDAIYDASMSVSDSTGRKNVVRNIDLEKSLSRYQVATVFSSYADYLKLDTSHDSVSDLREYSDYTLHKTMQWNLDEFYAQKLSWAVYEGLIMPDENGKLNPNAAMKKGDFAKMLQAISINASGGVRGNDGNSSGGSISPGAISLDSLYDMESSAQVSELTAERQNQQELQEEQPPEEEPEQQEQPEENLEVDKDVTRVTQDNSLSALIPIVGACVLIGGAAVIMLKRRKK